MRKVVIVDDEIWAVEGLRSAINWEELGYEIVATFTSSQKALDFLTENEVHTAILDIKMPHIDGLTLISMLKERQPDIRIIIVSGMTEFETARQALKLGVDEFLVKPIDTDALMAALKEKRRRAVRSEYSDLPDISALGNQLSQIGGDSSKNVFKSYLGLYKQYAYYFLCMSDFPGEDEREAFKKAFTLSGETVRFRAFGEHLVTAVFTDVYLDYQKAIGAIKTAFPNKSFGISQQKTDIADIQRAISECRQAFYSSFITGKTRLCEFKDSDWSFFNTFMQNVNVGIQERSLQKLDLAITNAFANADNFHIDELIMLSNSCLLAANMMSSSENFEYIPTAERIYERFSGVHELEEYLHFCIKTLAVRQSDDGALSKRSIMPMIKEYIDKNFGERISLTDLSEKFGISEKYLSKMFKKYTGENYAQYLNKVRINVALKMLQKTNLSVREIGEACGYSDYPYFARVFKKLTGLSATEIRQNLPK